MVEYVWHDVVRPDGSIQATEVVVLAKYQRTLVSADYWDLTEAEGIIYDDLFTHIWPLRNNYQYQTVPLKAIALFLNNLKTPIRHFVNGEYVELSDYFKEPDTAEFIYHLLDTNIVATTVTGQEFVEEVLSHGSKRRLNIAHLPLYVWWHQIEESDFPVGGMTSVVNAGHSEWSYDGWVLSNGGEVTVCPVDPANPTDNEITVGGHSTDSSNATIGWTISASADARLANGKFTLGTVTFKDGTYISFRIDTAFPNRLETKIEYDSGTTSWNNYGDTGTPYWPPTGDISIQIKAEWVWDNSSAVRSEFQFRYIAEGRDGAWQTANMNTNREFTSPKTIDHFRLKIPEIGSVTLKEFHVH